MNADKFNFRKTEVKYAGYILTNTGHKPDPSKVQAIVEMPPPKDVAGVRRFIGMTNYFAKYLSKLSQLSEPPRQLTKGDTVWEWTHEQSAAFEQIKTALTSAPVLAFFDKSLQSSTVQCDASQAALGAVLMQEGRSISYASRALSHTEQNYAQIEKELLAVVFAMEKFGHYTYGRHIVVESDHKPLQAILKKPIATAPKRLQRMLLQLQRYSFDLTYKPGSRLVIADTLPRAPCSLDVGNTSNQQEFETVCAVVDAQLADPLMSSLRRATSEESTLLEVQKLIAEGWPMDRKRLPQDVAAYFNVRDELVYDDGVIFKGDRCVIPASMRECDRRAAQTSSWSGSNFAMSERDCFLAAYDVPIEGLRQKL